MSNKEWFKKNCPHCDRPLEVFGHEIMIRVFVLCKCGVSVLFVRPEDLPYD